MLLGSTTYLFESMAVLQHKFDELTDLEHKLRDGKISHAVSMFEKNVERYSDSRALVSFLENGSCSISDYDELDQLITQIVDWFWLFRYENVKAAFFIGDSFNGSTQVHCGVQIPDSKKEALLALGIENAVAPCKFQEAYSQRIELVTKSLLSKLLKN